MPVLNLLLSGGLELLFPNACKSFPGLDVPAPVPGGPLTVRATVAWVAATLLSAQSRVSLFVGDDGGLRPGILCLVNDADYSLLGGEDAELEDGDTVIFISTLHGG